MRVFIAIDLPEEIKNKIFSIYKDVKGVQGKFVERENLHITLKFLGELQPNIVEDVKNILDNVKYEKFAIRVKGIGMFGSRVLWIGVSKGFENIVKLHNIIDEELYKIKFPKDYDFHPHITILRIKNIVSKKDFDHFIEKYKDFEFGEFEVKEFKLKQSILRPEGPIYLDIQKYGLL